MRVFASRAAAARCRALDGVAYLLRGHGVVVLVHDLADGRREDRRVLLLAPRRSPFEDVLGMAVIMTETDRLARGQADPTEFRIQRTT